MFQYIWTGGQETSVADIDGEAVEVQEVRSDDGHEDVCDYELPGVPLRTIVELELFGSVGTDGGTIGCLHHVC